jgi:hypothetical protein
MMKKALKTLVDQKMFKAKKDSYALTPRGRARTHGDMVHVSRASNPRTFLCDGITIVSKVETPNASNSIRVNREFDSNNIDESD